MAENFDHIPILNLNIPCIDSDAADIERVDRAALLPLAQELCGMLHNVGFVYLKHHGISQQKVDMINKVSKDFFLLPKETKMKYAKLSADDDNGWIQIGNENYSDIRPGDYKEAYDLIPEYLAKGKIPSDDDVPGFQDAFLAIYNSMAKLGQRMLYLIGLGLCPEDPHMFVRHHMGPCVNAARSLYYPPVKDAGVLLPQQIGCGEHTDFGSITFVFQDNVGGLEVLNKKGVFVKATPIPGTVVMNVADSLQRWTADKLVSTVHRVMVPAENKAARQSFAFFIHPDNDFTIECYDGSNKYEPVNAEEFMRMRYRTSFK